MADIVLICPRFEKSFWGMEHALPILGPLALMPPAGLLLLAAVTPPEHEVTIIDENVEAIDYDRCARADIVGLTGMSVQRHRIHEILVSLKQRDVFTVVGGPWVTVQEDYFAPEADVIFIGEAEDTWPLFLREWTAGRHAERYEQASKTDMSKVPVPRFDLAKMHSYAHGSVQFSRGCPFTCEFCDIIQTFGRKPRLKSKEQVSAELTALFGAGMRAVFIVDDNLIGNKKAIKPLLREVILWQETNGYPFVFFTEASLDLAEDKELMDLMVEAGIYAVFVGIESPSEDALLETRKVQNVRKGATIVERVRTIQAAGLEVWSGMIVGFDADPPAIFGAQRRFLDDARIAAAMIGMLSAIPKTPLHARLLEERRLDVSDRPAFGTNVIPLRMGRAELHDGYVNLMQEVYAPEAYFARLDSLYIGGRLTPGGGHERYWRKHPLNGFAIKLALAAMTAGVFMRLMRQAPARLRGEYRRRMLHIVKLRPNPVVLFAYVIRCVMHLHFHRLAEEMSQGTGRTLNTI